MYTLDYNPGPIDGYIVLKKKTPVFEEYTVVSGSRLIDNDVGNWMGTHLTQMPTYSTHKVCVGYDESWYVYTPEEYMSFALQLKVQSN
jgi:hypothetical protein